MSHWRSNHLFLVLALAACATRGPLPEGDDLESSPELASERPLPPSEAPANEAELSQAFERPAAVSARPTGLPLSASVTEETSAQSVAELEAAEALRSAHSAAGRRDWELTEASLALLPPSSLPPPQQQQHAGLSFQLAMAKGDKPGAAKAAERWLLACGPQKPDTCRNKALAALRKAAPADKRLATLREADACVQKLEALLRGPGPVLVPGCLSAALPVYRRMRDGLMEARIRYGKALALSREKGKANAAIAPLEAAERSCEQARCAELRSRALRHLSRLHANAKRPADAARAALREMELLARALPPEKQMYARTQEVAKRCAELDAAEGEGTCRRLERSMFGRYTFHDYGRERPREELSTQQVKQVNAHYGVLLQDCLLAQAARLKPSASRNYEVRWSIQNNGRVADVRVSAHGQDDADFASCLREQFAHWRYPPYHGEQQHIEQRFGVSSRERAAR